MQKKLKKIGIDAIALIEIHNLDGHDSHIKIMNIFLVMILY